MKNLVLIENSVYDIPSRVRGICDSYRIYYNVSKKRFELHHIDKNPTFQIVLPYSTLDYRVIDYINVTRIDRQLKYLENLDEYNNRVLEKNNQRIVDELCYKAKNVFNHINNGGVDIPNYSSL